MPAENKLRIGITMRITDAAGYSEKRDSLARDWSKYLLTVFPDSAWLYIPNIENAVIEYVEKWKINAFIFSGGDNMGATPERDLTETILYEYAMRHRYPVLGICRGLQIVCSALGTTIETPGGSFSEIHKAKKHSILLDGHERVVNSYHENKLAAETLAEELKILATCTSDNTVEAVSGNSFLGLMWHPEREESFQEWNTELIKKFFVP